MLLAFLDNYYDHLFPRYHYGLYRICKLVDIEHDFLKKLSSADLATISDDFGEILEIEVSKAISTKELDDLDLDIIVSYENNQLDVDVDVGVTFDKLSEITQDQVAGAIDEAYLKFDSYIDENYRQ